MKVIKMCNIVNTYCFTGLTLLFALIFNGSHCYGQPNAWINEIHYDNDGSDSNEGIELVIESPDSWNLSLFRIDFYNGTNGASYLNHTADIFIEGISIGDFTIYSLIISGIQNGAPDGMALSYNDTLIQFLSYEGSFTASEGPATGQASIDIGVYESTTSPIGHSLQLSGSATDYNGFKWQSPSLASLGGINNNQSYTETIEATIKLISPSGKEEYYAGDSMPILWSSHNAEIIDILLYNPHKDLWLVMADNVANDSTANIVIPAETMYSNHYRIAIIDTSDTSIADTSNLITINSRRADTNSYITSPDTQISADTIIVVNADSKSEAFPVFSFTIADQASGDGLPTELSQITLYYGENNSANFNLDIDSGYFDVNGRLIELSGNPIFGKDSIVFPVAPGEIIVDDGGILTIEYYLILTKNPREGMIIQFSINQEQHGFQTNANGSGLMSNFEDSIVGNIFTIDVLAEKLQFQQSVHSTLISDTIRPAIMVEAVDANGNIDTDYHSEVSLTAQGAELINTSHLAMAVSGIATFDKLIFNTSGYSVNLIASARGLTKTTSDSFEVFALTSTNADLRAILINDSAVHGFNPIRLNYTIELPNTSTQVPDVSYTLADTLASVFLRKANTLPGTTTIEVRADNGKKRTYSIDFELEPNSFGETNNRTIQLFPSLVYSELNIQNSRNIEYLMIFDAFGKLVYQQKNNGIDQLVIHVEYWNPGIYTIRAVSENEFGIFRFIKE